MTSKVFHTPISRASEKGVVLVVGLIIVLLISIVALAAIKGSNLQEAMVGNTRDHNIAFQAAEAGLASGEAVVDDVLVPVPPVFPGATGSGLLETNDLTPLANSVIYMSDATFNTNGYLLTGLMFKTDSQPVYIIEELPVFSPNDGSAVELGAFNSKWIPYRITAKGVGLTAEATVIVQSYYNRIP